MGRAMGFGFPPETPEHTRCKRTEECGKQEGIAPERRVKKCRANCADEEKRTGVIGKNKDVSGVFLGKQFFFVEHGCNFRTHGITGEYAQKKRKSADAGQPEKRFHNRLQKAAEPFRRTKPQQKPAGRHKGKQRGQNAGEPEGRTFGRGSKHSRRIAQKGEYQETGTYDDGEGTFFHVKNSFRRRYKTILWLSGGKHAYPVSEKRTSIFGGEGAENTQGIGNVKKM